MIDSDLLDKNSGCCGASFEREHISIAALLTVSLPYVFLFRVLSPLFWLTELVLRRQPRLLTILRRLFTANYQLIKDAPVRPKLRCALGGRAFELSPWLGGVVFKSFNIVVLSSIWVIVVASTGLVWLGVSTWVST